MQQGTDKIMLLIWPQHKRVRGVSCNFLHRSKLALPLSCSVNGIELKRLAVPLRLVAGLDQAEESEGTGSEAGVG
jgi:hypothetical protein